MERGVNLFSEQRTEDDCIELKCLIKILTMSDGSLCHSLSVIVNGLAGVRPS